jgi:hypothetical protein
MNMKIAIKSEKAIEMSGECENRNATRHDAMTMLTEEMVRF